MAKRDKTQDPIQQDPGEVARLATIIYDDIQQAQSDRSKYLALIEKHRRLLKAHQEDEHPPWKGACTLHVPFLKYARNNLLARIRRALLTPTPLLYAEGLGPAKQFEGAFENFLQRQLTKQMQFARTGRRLLQGALDDGTAIAYVRWETIQRRELRYRMSATPEYDADGKPVYDVEHPFVPLYDGPVVDYVPIEHCSTFPAAFADVQRSPGLYLRFPMFGEQILQNLVRGIYDPKGVEELLHKLGDQKILENPDDKLRSINLAGSSFQFDPSFNATPLQITECYWRFPSAKTANDEEEPGEDWLVTMYESSQTVLRMRPVHSVWGFSERPVVPVRMMPDKFGILGDSLGDLAADGQEYLTLFQRQMANAGERRLNPELFQLANAMSRDEWEDFNADRRPGTIHPIRNVNQVSDALLPFGFDGNPYEAQQVMAKIEDNLRVATGVSKLMTGNAAGSRTTAIEIQQMQEEGQEVVMDMVDTAGESLADIGQFIRKLDYVYAGRASIQQLWAEANPGAPPEALLSALQGTYDLSASGTTLTTSKSLRKQQAMERFQIFKDDPFVAANLTHEYRLRRDLLVAMGERQPESIIGTEQDALTAQQQIEAQRAGGSPPAGGAVPGSGPVGPITPSPTAPPAPGGMPHG